LLDELEGGITSCDFKIKRQGKGKDTTYKWIIMPSTIRPLNEQERALADEVPNFDELFPIKPPVEMKRRAAEWLASQNAAPVSNDDEQPGDDEIPF
jgi:hypothetical protein